MRYYEIQQEISFVLPETVLNSLVGYRPMPQVYMQNPYKDRDRKAHKEKEQLKKQHRQNKDGSWSVKFPYNILPKDWNKKRSR